MVHALEAQTLPSDEWEAVIVDDCSTDDTATVLSELAQSSGISLRWARTPHRSGPATARNQGWRSTTANVLAFTDDDCVPAPEWLETGLSTITADPTTGILQGRTVLADRASGGVESIRIVHRQVLAPSPWFEGCNLFIRRAALEAGGGFDEDIAWVGEETALGWSILDKGWRRGWAPDAVVRHDVEERGLGWHLRSHYLEGHAVRIAARYPSIRDTWWRPWAIERRGALFALAAVGGVVSTRRKSALLLALPYLADLFPPGSRPPSRADVSKALARVVWDTASLTGKLVEGVRARTLVV